MANIQANFKEMSVPSFPTKWPACIPLSEQGLQIGGNSTYWRAVWGQHVAAKLSVKGRKYQHVISRQSIKCSQKYEVLCHNVGHRSNFYEENDLSINWESATRFSCLEARFLNCNGNSLKLWVMLYFWGDIRSTNLHDTRKTKDKSLATMR